MIAPGRLVQRVLDGHFFEHGDVDWPRRYYQSGYAPSGPGNYRAHLAGRHDQVVEPGSPRVAITNTKAELPRKPSSSPVQLVVTPVIGTRGLVRVSRFGQNPPRRRSQPMEAPEQPSSPTSVAEQPKVVSKHHDRVE